MNIVKKIIDYFLRLFTSFIYFPALIFLLLEMAEIYILADDYMHFITVFVMGISIVALSVLVIKYNKLYSYVICSICAILTFWCLSTESVKILQASSYCLESGRGVWDYEKNVCRHDCLRWTKEEGCISLCGNDEIWDDEKGCLKKSEEE